jgi:glycosyltransferase involved in cell wall biosynthesis
MSRLETRQRPTRSRTPVIEVCTTDRVPPLVSVVIPAWNVAAYIGEAIDGALAQRYPSREVIVVNDGSPDVEALDAVMHGYEGLDEVRYVTQPNGGPSAARNTGVRLARGELVAFLDGDDYWEADYLDLQVERLRRDPAIDLVYCDAWLFGDGALAGRRFMEAAPSEGEPTFEALVSMRCAIPTTCVVARREAMIAAGLFDDRFRRCEDYDLWMRMSARGSRVAYHRAVPAWHRIRAGSAAADRAAMFEAQALVYEKLAGIVGSDHAVAGVLDRARARATADHALERAKQHLEGRRYRAAAADVDRAYAYYGTAKLGLARWGIVAAPALIRRLYLRAEGARVQRAKIAGVQHGSPAPPHPEP